MNLSTSAARVIVWLLLVGGAVLRLGDQVFAQESREEVIAAEQADKAKQLTTYVPTRVEKLLLKVQAKPRGLHPYVGSVYPGGGLALGAGFRQFFGDRTYWDLKGLYSVKNYKLVELSSDSLGQAGGRLDLHGRVGWRDATQVAFFGLGPDSPEDQTNFRMKQGYVGGDVSVRPVPWTITRAGMSYEDFSLAQGLGRPPSIEERHSPASAPGLGANPTYLRTMASAGIDWRPSPDYARRGGLYEISYLNYADRANTHSFDRLDAELVQHIPILRENWVVSLHGLVQTTMDDDDIVPYFLMPSLGSGSTLRAYHSWRFRDRHAMLMSAEWRWIPNRLALDMALFYDAGKVASRRQDLGFDGLKSDVGIGIRFHTSLATPLRIELASGSEGLHLVFAGGAAF